MIPPLRIATRRSALALWQARHVAELLRLQKPQRVIELVEVATRGDVQQGLSSTAMTGTGWFTKEIQQAVLAGQADLAVHSLKDLPTESVPGLSLAAVPSRGPWADVLVSVKYPSFAALPPNAVVATGSPRRRAQLLRAHPDLQIRDLRGNVDSRLAKLESEGLDAIVLAEAGLVRLALMGAHAHVLTADEMLPAVGQGALGVECRSEDRDLILLLAQLDDPLSRAAATAERAVLRAVGGGCRAALGCLAVVHGEQLRLRAGLWSGDGRLECRAESVGSTSAAGMLGTSLGQDLAARFATLVST